jgi:general secretion pathway protein E/type IV pilus assembly protein PilB
MHGESIVFRILDQEKILLKLSQLGFEEDKLKILKRFTSSPYGIVFVTGPTGSGKTTTLYAALNEVKSIENKVFTVEDPVEYQLPLAQQIQVNEKIGFNFSIALKSLLRQDPDIMMIGEIRDIDTLNIAVQASLTGHLVFSTLHTNDAPSAITRMVQMGLEPFLIADSLIGILSQRLVRKICPHCKIEHKPTRDTLHEIGKYLPSDYKFFKGQGCPKCNHDGYLGRILISEILEVTPKVAHDIVNNVSKDELTHTAKEEGYKPMVVDGISKALRGITTLDEVLRVAKG